MNSSSFDDHTHPATIQIPTGEPNGAKLQVESTFTGMEGKRLMLESAERISLSTPVSVEYNDAMFLGEVLHCQATANGQYHIEIIVEQILTGLQSLMALRDGLLGEAKPQTTRAFAPVNTQKRIQKN